MLSSVLNLIAAAGANILTINQNIPINKIANVTITIETNAMDSDIGFLMNSVENIQGVISLNIIARE